MVKVIFFHSRFFLDNIRDLSRIMNDWIIKRLILRLRGASKSLLEVVNGKKIPVLSGCIKLDWHWPWMCISAAAFQSQLNDNEPIKCILAFRLSAKCLNSNTSESWFDLIEMQFSILCFVFDGNYPSSALELLLSCSQSGNWVNEMLNKFEWSHSVFYFSYRFLSS